MTSIPGFLKYSLNPRKNKLLKVMYDKFIKDNTGASEDDYLNYASYLSDQGKAHESLEILSYAIKQFPDEVSLDKIVPIVTKIVNNFRQETKESLDVTRNIFSCPWCYGVLYEPMTIPCGHTYCKQCTLKELNYVCKVCLTDISPAYDPQLAKTNVLIAPLVDKWWANEVEGVKLRNKGNEFFKAKNYEEAQKCYTEAIQIAPNDHILMSKRSSVFLTMGRKEDAIEDAEEAVKICPRWAKGHYCQTMALLSLSRGQEALASLLLCACLVTPKDLNSIVNELSEVFLSSMRSTERQLSVQTSIPFLNEDNSSDDDLQAEAAVASVKAVKFVSLRKRRLSDNQPSTSEEIPIIKNILKLFHRKVKNVRNSTTAYNRKAIDGSVTKADFECTLCYLNFWQPVTTPCGHTFCRACLDRCLDHAPSCPLCKSSLKDYLAERRSSVNEFLEDTVKILLPDEYRERGLRYEQELNELARAGSDLSHEIPVFVATIAIPSIKCPLHVFEPRYKLMVRRCIEAGTREFGMCISSDTGINGYADYGTMLQINEITYSIDGRSVVKTIGTRRFKCVSKSTKDGYNTASVEYLKDTVVRESEIEQLKQIHNSVYEKAQTWFSTINIETMNTILAHYGSLPPIEEDYWTLSDGPNWIWWLITILPLEPSIQIRVLKQTTLKSRLEIINRILRIALVHQNRITQP